jgi:enoyl-CoA hydratase
MSLETNVLLYEVKDGIAYLTLNRPDKLNSLSFALRDKLGDTILEAEKDSNVRVIVLKGSGRAFCTGMDLTAAQGGPGMQSTPSPETGDPMIWKDRFEKLFRTLNAIFYCSKPTIAMVHGYAVGAGFWLSNSCDMIICADDCKFGTPEIRFASASAKVVPVWNMGRNQMISLLLTGDFIDGKKAEAIGLAYKSVPIDRLEKEVLRVARKLCLVEPMAIQMQKKVINMWYGVERYRDVNAFSVVNDALQYASEPHKRLSDRKGLSISEYTKKVHEPFKAIDKEYD